MRIVSVCSLCGHEYASWWGEAEYDEHMAEVHRMRFEPGSLRRGDPPRWVSMPAQSPHGTAINDS